MSPDRAQTPARKPRFAAWTPPPQPILLIPEPVSPSTPVVPVRPVVRTLDVFCLLCACGVGRGVRRFPHRLPCRRRCIWCGVRPARGGSHPRDPLREERATVGRKLLDEGAPGRAPR